LVNYKSMDVKSLVRALHALKSGELVPEDCLSDVSQALTDYLKNNRLPDRPNYMFKPYGNGWLIGDDSIQIHFPARKTGFSYIHYLLKYPGQKVPALLVYHLGAKEALELVRHENAIQNARKTVQKRVKTTLDEILVKHPALGHHLKYAINTGRYISYTPDPVIAPIWDLFQSGAEMAHI